MGRTRCCGAARPFSNRRRPIPERVEGPFTLLFRRVPMWKVALAVALALAVVAALAVAASIVFLALLPVVFLAVIAHRVFAARRSNSPADRPGDRAVIEGVYIAVGEERVKVEAPRRDGKGRDGKTAGE